MSDITLRYRVSPKIIGAAQQLACRSQKIGRGYTFFSYFLFFLMALAFLYCLPLISQSMERYLLFLGFIAVYAQCTRLRARLYYRKTSEEWGETTLSLQEDGLEIIQVGVRSLYSWASLREIREIQAGKENAWLAIFLDSVRGQLLPIPFSAFANDAERQAFVDAVNAGIGKGKPARAEASND
ncbi:MAG: hypothetical protein LBU11_08785 [Zoogloeaceae bacterium]|jgi:hypothetical protein|nr:hypothetical protein [Zoogloeaceae bacterium]